MRGEMGVKRAALAYVRQWSHDHPDACSRDFHNMLLRQLPGLRSLLDLFAMPAPAGRGRYNHHDGMRP